jgi:hydroxymethylpyrimidine pyrophosphatase-like HAD family hydrolase
MRYLALACDYDGTLALRGRVDEPTLAALENVLASGRKLILVTGRELEELLGIFPPINLFAAVVAENGALLYKPGSREEKVLAERPPEAFVRELRRRGVGPISVGRVIVATWKPHETAVLGVIRDLGLDLQVIFNKDAVMVLPAGVTKAWGLKAALRELGLSPHNVVGVGDAENDLAFLGLCECGVAVDNALPMVQEKADFVTRGDHGAGVRELIEELVATDLHDLDGRLTRHHILLGHRTDGRPVFLPPYGHNVLIAGSSGSGKSTLTTGVLERLGEQKYQFCIIDPEGDYDPFEKVVPLGNAQRAPSVDEILEFLKNQGAGAIVNLVGLPLVDRPPFFLALLPRLQELRASTGLPHWLVVDEAHHLLPAAWEPAGIALPQALAETIFITVHPDQVSPPVISTVDTAIVLGNAPGETLAQFCRVLGQPPPQLGARRGSPDPADTLEPGEALFWSRSAAQPPLRIRVAPSHTERRRHSRKYAEGELPPDRSFYFRGPRGKLHLRAQNLILFLQMADGVDEETWLHHLRGGEYSRWFQDAIKDEGLAEEARRVEALTNVTAAESRKQIRAAIEERYTLPASSPLPLPGTDAAAARK